MTPSLSAIARDEIAEIIGRYAHTIRPITEIHRELPKGNHSMSNALFLPAVEQLASQLVDIGDSTAAMLAELSRDPSPERCELAQARLRDLERYVGTLRQAAVAKAA